MRFYQADYVETCEPLENPDCGWYHIYPFILKDVPGTVFPDLGPLARSLEESGKERLALIQFHIGFFRERELTAGILGHMERILSCFCAAGKQMILRIAYDLEGKGLLWEPTSEALIHRHMEQVAPLICRYAWDILALQGIFVGNWGEMHGSRFLSESAMARLVSTLYRTTGGACFLAVRTPAQWRGVMARLSGEAGLEEKLTLFNDGLFGSDTDLGTYGVCRERRGDEAGRRRREEELEWQSRMMTGKPVGGEAVAALKPVGYIQGAAEMAKIHICYLNSAYHKGQLDFWRGETVNIPGCWAGLSGYDYIGRHLGPRFVIRDVKKMGRKLLVLIQNQGFSGVCKEADCFLITEWGNGRKEELRLDTDMRDWRGGQTVKLLVPLQLERDGKDPVQLSLTLRKRDRRILRFANQGAGDSVRLGWIK